MKNIIFLLSGLILISVSTFGQIGYKYKSRFVELKADSSMYFIQTEEKNADTKNAELKESEKSGKIKSFVRTSENRFIVFDRMYKADNHEYISLIYRSTDKNTTIILPRVVVRLNSEGRIEDILKKYNGRVSVESNDGNIIVLNCFFNNSNDILQLVEELESMNEIEWCEPEMISEYKLDNPLYPQQYYLRNTGQNGGIEGVDINVEPAWNITNGTTNITIAVIDCGVDRNHEDMGNRVKEGYTIRNITGRGVPQNVNNLNSKAHGMACAGIIASTNNNIGTRGVANNCSILPINIVPDLAYTNPSTGRTIEGFGTNIEIAQAINWAWKRSDILSCSWGGGNPSNYITTAIDSARTFGRNGKGAIVVFASGNGNPDLTDVIFPGNVNGVITVGAINNQGTIWNYSQRGQSMDLVAPSGNVNLNGDVRTTDRMGTLGYETGNYTERFGGTSAACPQVSGVVALMLSVRPDLTETQITTILQNTARDLGSSGFDYTYGHGLVNAHAAVVNALLYNVSITGPVRACSQETYSIQNFEKLPQGTTVQWSTAYGNINLQSAQGANPAIFTKIRNGTDQIQARITYNNQNFTLTPLTVYFGAPVITSISGSQRVPNGQYASFRANVDPNGPIPTRYEWILNPQNGNNIYGNGSVQIDIAFYNAGNYQLVCRATNSCGVGDYYVMGLTVYDAQSPYSVYPNPATDMVTVEIPEGQADVTTQNIDKKPASGNYEIQIWNSVGVVRRFTTQQRTYQFSVSDLPKGLYFVHIIKDGKTVYRQKLIKN